MISDKVACIVTREQHQERINEVAAAEYKPLLVVTTEDRVKSHNHVDMVVVESVQDRYIRVWGNKMYMAGVQVQVRDSDR